MTRTMTMDRPVDLDETMLENERPCDSRTVDITVRPWKITSQCSRPAEWIYVMKCCGRQALACDPCHDMHLNPAPSNRQRHCIHCERQFIALGDGCIAVYRV